MELFVWHNGLGSDDEQATEEELYARIMYAYSSKGPTDEQLSSSQSGNHRNVQVESLHLLQGLVTFTRLLQKPNLQNATSSSSSKDVGDFISATLSKRRFVIKQVEPDIYMALGIEACLDHNILRTAHQSILRNLYETFILFHGTISQQLRVLPSQFSSIASTCRDGLEHLHQIQSVRKQIRKLRILMDNNSVHSISEGEVDGISCENKMKTLERQLQELLGDDDNSTSAHLVWNNLESFFPKLLYALDVRMLSAFHGDLSGLGYFPMEQDTFLKLQSFVNDFQFEFQDKMKDLALFYKGNVLWNSMSPRRLHLLQQFLRCREQDGMDVDSIQPLEIHRRQKENDGCVDLWMTEKSEDAFLPVWASKTSYAECAVVRYIGPQPRKWSLVRSLHKQNSSSLSSIIADMTTTTNYTEGNSTTATAERIMSKRPQRFRSSTACYKNHGFLSNSGHYMPSYEHTNATLWAPMVHPEPDQHQDKTNHLVRVVVWHEGDVTVLMTIPHDMVHNELLEQFEQAFKKFNVREVANMIWTRYQQMNAANGNSREKSNVTLPPFIYLNRVNFAFKAEQIPRLIKSRDDDVFPRPRILLAHYFPPQSLNLLTRFHAALHSNEHENEEIWIKTVNDGWVTGKRSKTTGRELYAFYDTKVASIGDLYEANQELLQTQFENIFL